MVGGSALHSSSGDATNQRSRQQSSLLLPELNHGNYVKEVLGSDSEQIQAMIDDELATRAAALDIPSAITSSRGLTSTATPETTLASSLSSFSSAATPLAGHYHTRSPSALSAASTALTSQSAMESASVTTDTEGTSRGSCLGFLPYDKYLSARMMMNGSEFDNQENLVSSRPFSGHSLRHSRSIASGLDWNGNGNGNGNGRGANSSRSLITRLRGWRGRRDSRSGGGTQSSCCSRCFEKSDEMQMHKSSQLHELPCRHHRCCGKCLRTMASQARTAEAKMPPRCCERAVPSSTLAAVLPRSEQEAFIAAVVHYSTPTANRVDCPNDACSDFVVKTSEHQPHASCRRCETEVCLKCGNVKHVDASDCPEIRRRQRLQAEANLMLHRREYHDDDGGGGGGGAEGSAEESFQTRKARQRTENCLELMSLKEQQEEERRRFVSFERAMRLLQKKRHLQKRAATTDRHDETTEKLKERHIQAARDLEDTQVLAEMDLRKTLEQSEKIVQIRLKHMEAYCNGLGRGERSEGDDNKAQRVVTERDLRELGQQYNVRDSMERSHQAKINVMRDRQAKDMERLMERHEDELARLQDKQQTKLECVDAEFAREEETLMQVFQVRKMQLVARWELVGEVLRKQMEASDGVQYGRLALPRWDHH